MVYILNFQLNVAYTYPLGGERRVGLSGESTDLQGKNQKTHLEKNLVIFKLIADYKTAANYILPTISKLPVRDFTILKCILLKIAIKAKCSTFEEF